MLHRAKAGESLWVTHDSSCWIEYLRDTPLAELFASAAENPEQLIVPIVTIYEVTKKLHCEISPKVAVYAEALMCRDVSSTLTWRCAALPSLPPCPWPTA